MRRKRRSEFTKGKELDKKETRKAKQSLMEEMDQTEPNGSNRKEKSKKMRRKHAMQSKQ